MKQQSLRTLLIDDEVDARAILRIILRDYPQVQIVGEAEDLASAQSEIKLLQPDLVFLDIQIGADNGLDMLDGFPERKFQVVVCTGYDNYAIKAIKQKALDYILKPIDPDELASAIKKATLAKIQAEPKRLILTATDGADHLVAPAQICRIESDGAYTTLHLNNDRRFTQARSLREFEEELPYFFVRVHQSHLININEIAQFHANDMMVQMNNGDHLPVARRRKAELMEVIGR